MHDFLEFVHEVRSHLEHLVTSLWDRRHHRQVANDAAESAAAHAVGQPPETDPQLKGMVEVGREGDLVVRIVS